MVAKVEPAYEPANASSPFEAEFVRVIRSVSAYQARRLARSLSLGTADREDAEQEILLILLERAHYFDAARGLLTAFANRLARQAAQQVADDLIADRRRFQALPSDHPDANGDAAEGQQPLSTSAPTSDDLLIGLAMGRFLFGLPDELRLVAEAAVLADGDPGDAWRITGLSKSEFHRRLEEVRMRLRCIDILSRRRGATPEPSGGSPD